VAANRPLPRLTPPPRTTLRKPRPTPLTHRPPPRGGRYLIFQYRSCLLSRETDHWILVEVLDGHLGKEVVGDDMHFTTDLIRNYSERQQLLANKLKRLPPPPTPRTKPQNARRPIRPTHPPPPAAGRSLPPPYRGLVLRRETETRQTTSGIRYSLLERYSSVFCFNVEIFRKPLPLRVHPPYSISSHLPISLSIIPSHSAPSANSTGTLIQQQNPPINRPVDLHSPTSQAVHEDDAESDATQMVQPLSQSSQHGTVPRILTWRKPHSPKRHMDIHFMGSMADIWRQNGTNSMDSTPPVSLILPRFSYASFAVSHSLYVASLPPVVEFPPTPVFKDEIPEGIMQMVKVNSARLFESDHLHRLTTTPAPLISSPPAKTQPENALNNTNVVAKIGAGPYLVLFVELGDILTFSQAPSGASSRPFMWRLYN